MNPGHELAFAAGGDANFDMLRARLEFKVASPAVVAFTSGSAADGKESSAAELAYSLAMCGYTTLLLDTRLASRGQVLPPQRLTFEEAGSQLARESGTGKLALLNLDHLLAHNVTSQRIASAFKVLRSTFDYVIVNTECGASTAFAKSVMTAADAVLVTVGTGRRINAADLILAKDLERLGPRFLGIVAIHQPTVKRDVVTRALTTVSAFRFSNFRLWTLPLNASRRAIYAEIRRAGLTSLS
jgi:hypothetical protein